MLRRSFLIILASALIGALHTPARADSPMFYTGGGKAINGFDTVAYFTVGEPVQGRPEIAVMWKGAIWQFASEDNRETFESDPRAYAPQFGGYCAYAVSRGYHAQTEPEAWEIVDGKLYLIRSPHVRAIWEQDIEGNIAKANANWPGVLRK